MNYRLIVIENSLKDKNILKNYNILSKTLFEKGTPQESVMYKIEIPVDALDLVTELLKKYLILPYYAHLYHEDPKDDNLIVIFNDKVFKTHKSNYSVARNYGISHGVTNEQMKIEPIDVQEESW